MNSTTLRNGFVFACLAICAVAPAQSTQPRNIEATKIQFNSWKLPVPPRHIIANINYVGAAGVSSFLITTPEGHILIDTTFEDVVPLIQKNIEQLGYKWQDIKLIISSHAHVDHVGGHALMKRLTHATIVSSALDAHLMETGGDDDFSPLPKELLKYTPVKADRIISDGEQVTLGGTTLTAHFTPGHTKGATTWTMPITEEGKTYKVVFFSSATIGQGTKLVRNSIYPNIADDFEATYKKVKQLDCDIFFAPHGGQFAMSDKFARFDQGVKPNPFIDPQGWKKLIADSERTFRAQLDAERKAAVP